MSTQERTGEQSNWEVMQAIYPRQLVITSWPQTTTGKTQTACRLLEV
jgi:hypothetical protein